jgi:hypothetical protein
MADDGCWFGPFAFLALAPSSLPPALRFSAPGRFDRFIDLRVASFDMSRNAEIFLHYMSSAADYKMGLQMPPILPPL